MIARRADRLEALRDRLGAAALTLVADMAEESAMLDAGEQAAETFGGLVGVVANAGITHIGTMGGGDRRK